MPTGTERRLQLRTTLRKHMTGKVWDVVVMRSGWTAKNPPELFPAEILADAVRMFEGLVVNAYGFGELFAHTPDEVQAEHENGTFLNQIGILRDARMDQDNGTPAIRAQLHVDSDDIAAKLRSRMDSASPPELSVDLITMATLESGGLRVRRILKANSTDVVTAGAAGGRFDRMVASQGVPMEIRTVEELKSQHPTLVEAAVAVTAKERDDALAELEESKAENVRLTESIKVARLLESKGIADAPEWFVKSIIATPDEADRKQILEDWRGRTTESDEVTDNPARQRHGATKAIEDAWSFLNGRSPAPKEEKAV